MVVGRFQVRGRLGSGTFATVYRAYDPQLDREVALKVPHPGTLDDPDRRKHFLREARAAAGLWHPHIVPVYEFTVAPAPYLAEGFVEGRTLAAVLHDGPLDPREAARMVRGLAEALAYAHEKGVVHRDVKPANVLLDDKGEPHLVDFGLAFRREGGDRLTQDTDLVGTPEYLAPEAVTQSEAPPSAAVDQYALGVVLYESLTGRLPFEGLPEAVLYQAVHGEFPRPSRIRAGLPRDLETICLKATARRERDRYASCAELAEDLRRWQDGELIQARRAGPMKRLGRWCGRNRPVASLLAVVAVLLVVGTVVSSVLAAQALAAASLAQVQRLRADENAERMGLLKEQADRDADRMRELKRQADNKAEDAAQQWDRAESLLYASQLMLAQREWQDNNAVMARKFLKECAQDRRGWEYRYLNTLFYHLGQQTFPGRSQPCLHRVFQPGWPARGRRQPGPTGEGVGCGERAGGTHPQRAHQLGPERVFPPGWPAPGQ